MGTDVADLMFPGFIKEVEFLYQHAHQIEVISELTYFRTQITKVLGNDVDVRILAVETAEEVMAAVDDPLTVDGCFFRTVDLPICVKCSEMVDPYDVVDLLR